MEQLYKDFLSVIKCGITGDKAEDTSALFDWRNIYAITHAHKIHMMLYYGLLKGGFPVPDEVINLVKGRAFSETAFSMRQQAEMEDIFKKLEDKNIEFLPLKGAIMKKLYPTPDMRLMSDVDVLIKEEQYDKIVEILKESGYEYEVESDHELVWKKSTLCLELHKYLVPTYNKDFYEYYGNGWKTATRCEGTHYYMSDEDFFIYMFLHFSKHYRDSGIGIRHIVDIWVCLKNCNLDMAYVEGELKKLSLYDFYVNIKKTLSVWFEGGEETPETELITQWIFESGVYGTSENNAVSRAIRKEEEQGDTSKANTYFRAFFPRYTSMCRLYPVLKKAPVLLPVFWIWRLLDRAFSGSNRLKKINEDMKVQTDENKNTYKELLDKVGLKL